MLLFVILLKTTGTTIAVHVSGTAKVLRDYVAVIVIVIGIDLTQKITNMIYLDYARYSGISSPHRYFYCNELNSH